jgi:hypothetical protein
VTYTIRNAKGEGVAGDRDLTEGLKRMCDREPGQYITDDETGRKVYWKDGNPQAG